MISISQCLFLNTGFLHRSVTHLNHTQTPTILLFTLKEQVDAWSYLMDGLGAGFSHLLKRCLLFLT